jgi:hypothetical protein
LKDAFPTPEARREGSDSYQTTVGVIDSEPLVACE